MKTEGAEMRSESADTVTIRPDELKAMHSDAMLSLICSSNALSESNFPETLVMDFERSQNLQNQFRSFIISASLLAAVNDAIIKTKNAEDLRVRCPVFRLFVNFFNLLIL
jgi:hypothetical protein